MKQRAARLTLVVLLGIVLLTAGASATSLSTIMDRGYLIFVNSGGFPPFSFFDAEQQLVGFDVDVARSLADQLGVQARVNSAEFATIVQGVQLGIFDVGVASQAVTPERAQAVEYLSRPYYCSGAQLFVPESSSVTDISRLDKPVAVALGTTYQQYLDAHGIAYQTFKDDPTGIQAMQSGIVGGLVTDLTVGLNAIHQGVAMKPAGDLLYTETIGITLMKGEPELKAALDRALDTLVENGTLRSISMKWFQSDITACAAEPLDL